MKYCNKWLIDNSELPCFYTMQHCEIYKRLNFLTLYTCQIKNIKIMIIISFLVLLFLYSLITYVTKHFYSKSVEKILEKLKINPIIASVSFLALANSLPDLLTTISSDKHMDGSYFILSNLVGSFIFNSTITVAFVVYKSKENIVLWKTNILKEILFILFFFCSFLWIGFFYGYIDFSLLYFLVFIYAIYFIITLVISFYFNLNEEEKENNNIFSQHINNKEADILTNKSSDNIKKIKKVLFISENKYSEKILNSPLSESEAKSTILQNSENHMKKHSKIFFIEIPLKIIFSMTVTSKNNNYFKNSYYRYIIIFFTIYFILLTILNDLLLDIKLVFIIAFSLIVVDYFTTILNSSLNFYIFELIAVLSCVCWMLNFIYLILDIFFFISIFLSVSNIILTVVIISIGNQLIGIFKRLFQ